MLQSSTDKETEMWCGGGGGQSICEWERDSDEEAESRVLWKKWFNKYKDDASSSAFQSQFPAAQEANSALPREAVKTTSKHPSTPEAPKASDLRDGLGL